ncbi:MAG: class I SAM-dependent methyltransferase [Thiobacillaceae bacterium]
MKIQERVPPSSWVRRFAPLIPHGGTVLDLACGDGRHARLLAMLGYCVEAVDRNAEALVNLAGVPRITTRAADLEGGAWPYAADRFDGIVVTNYLYRPRLAHLNRALRPGGILIYETFMVGNELVGKPSNPEFLLRPGELLDVIRPTLTVVAFEQGQVDMPGPAWIQRICAIAGEVPLLPTWNPS